MDWLVVLQRMTFHRKSPAPPATFADNDVRSRTVSRLFRRSLRQNSAQLPTKGELLLIAPLTFRVAYIQLRVLALDAAVIREP